MANSEKLSFRTVTNPKQFIPILEERKPQSCFMINQVMLYDNFKEDLIFFALGEEINSETWIVTKYNREDYGAYVSISAPAPVVDGTAQIPANVKEALSSGIAIDWDTGFVFVALEKRVSAMVIDISVNIKGNVTEVHPCHLYYMDKEEALELEICPGPDLEVRRLQESETDFIVKGWKYSIKGSDIVFRKNIKAAASGGVFIDGKCVSGVIMPGIGLVSSLYTLKEYRNRGLAKLTMKYAFKENAKDGCIPCSTVEYRNEKSVGFHQSLGVKLCSYVDWIDVKELHID